MINLLGIWMMLFAILLGWGLGIMWLFRRGGGAAFGGSLSAFQTMWLGYAGLLAFVQLVSLVLPIAELVLGLACLPAAAGWILQRRAIAARVLDLRRQVRTTAVLACVIFVSTCIAAWSALDIVQLYDTGLYHLQTVKWSTAYSTVPGLANLHMRFGYNNSVHLFGAFTDVFWEGVAVHIANGFFITVAFAQWFTEIFTARTPRGRMRQLFCMFTLPFLFSRLWTLEVASLSSDLPLAIFTFVIALEVLSLPKLSRDRSLLPLAVIVSLGAVAVSTKLGGLAVFGVTGVFALYVARGALATWRVRLVWIALPFVIIAGWLARGIVLSGWLIYPVFGRLPLSWSVPREIAAADLGDIQSWSRVPGQGPDQVFGHGFWHWFEPWLENLRVTHEFTLLVISAALLAWRAAHPPTRNRHLLAEWCAVTACVLALVQWFVGAPSLRYGGYLFWLLPATLFVPMITGAMRNATQRAFVLALALAYSIWSGGFAFRQFLPPKLWGRPHAPKRVIVEQRTSGPNTEVFTPTEGDQCFDAELPCTPTPRQKLRGRSIGDGFLP